MDGGIFLSTGSLVERRNGYDYNQIIKVIPALTDAGFISGGELMVIKLWYDKFPGLLKDFLSAGCTFPVIHSDKEIGTALSDAGTLLARGDRANSNRRRTEAFDMFRQCCEWGQAAGSSRLVLHLWGGYSSDRAIEYNIAALPELIEIAEKYEIRVMCENVPSSVTDPLTNWLKIREYFGRVGLVFDTRFATCHRQPKETLSNEEVFPHIEHVHISDYRGAVKDFSCLRPVYHPGEGIADFPLIFSYLRKKPGLTFTLESPGIAGWNDDRSDINEVWLRRSISFIRAMLTRDDDYYSKYENN